MGYQTTLINIVIINLSIKSKGIPMLTIYGYLADVQKCINCDSEKRLCTAKKTEFEFKSIADSKDENGPIFNENFEEMLLKLGRTSAVGISLPVVFEEDKHIGGFNELRAFVTKK